MTQVKLNKFYDVMDTIPESQDISEIDRIYENNKTTVRIKSHNYNIER